VLSKPAMPQLMAADGRTSTLPGGGKPGQGDKKVIPFGRISL
jgi:hypothetical protein